MIKETKITSLSKYKIHGGIHPEQNKQLSSESKSKRLPLANELLLPYITDGADFASGNDDPKVPVAKGDKVAFGQPLFAVKTGTPTTFFHSPCSAQVLGIENRNLGHPSGLKTLSISLKPDQPQTAINKRAASFEPIINWQSESIQVLLDRIKMAAVVGLGGAVFPTHLKLSNTALPIKTLMINAMECEPYITCDDRLMREKTNEILQGALITAHIVSAEEILIGIEDNKEQAISSLESSIAQLETELCIKIIVAPTKYPSGGEKQLIQILTGKEVPEKHYPGELGITVLNVATLFAIKRAVVDGFPLTSRLVTITGNAVKNAGNYWIDFGTSVSYIGEQLEIDLVDVNEIIFGGPLMGELISDPQIPTNKSTNCIIFNNRIFNNSISNNGKSGTTSVYEHAECIRCGQCEKVCPVSLLPQQLYWFSKSEQWTELEDHSLFDCIECGACSYVCPSEIPLVGYYRFAKSKMENNAKKLSQSNNAKQRFENREVRLIRIKHEREEKRRKTAEARKQLTKNKSKDPDGKKNAIQDALERVKKKKNNE